jgi:predicted homoserine dehydrogenase-like protein
MHILMWRLACVQENTLAAEIVAAAAKRVKGASAAISFALHSTEQLHGAELAAYEAAAVQAEPSAVPEPVRFLCSMDTSLLHCLID